jgi:hypothetical protein
VPKLPADFPGFYAAAKLVWNTPTKLYAYEDQLARQKSIDNRIGDSILSWLEWFGNSGRSAILPFLLGNDVPPLVPLVLSAGFVWSAHAARRHS